MSTGNKFRILTESKVDRLILFLVEQFLPAEAASQVKLGRVKKEYLEPFVKALRLVSHNYTDHAVGEELGPSVNSDKEAQAYSLYYLPINFVKIDRLIARCHLTPGYSVLDYGCGPGTGALSCLYQADLPPGEVTCVDHSSHMRRVVQSLLQAKTKDFPELRFNILDSLERVPRSQRFDLIIAANVFAEMDASASETLLTELLSRLTPRGSLLVVEPGQPLHTRRLMQLRDRIATGGDFSPVFPCTRIDACPMLRSSEDDWCHGTLTWERPVFIQQLDEMLEFNKHRLKYSAFVFKRSSHVTHPSNRFRVIVPGERGKRGIEATLCGPSHFGRVRLKPVERSEHNRPLERSNSFDLLEFDQPVSKELAPSTQVKLIE